MRKTLHLLAGVLILTGIACPACAQQSTRHWAIEVHAGAGDILRSTTDASTDAAVRATLAEAIQAGSAVLDKGGSSVDAVEAAIRTLENSTLFDAGRGAVFNADGKNELDAAIMDGSNLKAGAVAGVTRTRHPISLARAVMDKSPHVMLIGEGADSFAGHVGVEQVDPSFFFTETRWQELVEQLKREGRPVPPRPAGAPPAPLTKSISSSAPAVERHYGTVGVVALDRQGNVAAGTSTGGSQGKLPGRVGDSPIIGAGTYASNNSCAVSATGVGEYFIRLTIAREVCALVQYKSMPLQQAADEVIHKELETLHGVGGVIALTPDGQMAWSFNTPGMNRAWVREGGKLTIARYSDEPSSGEPK
jgi:beta-aspartyl-peptidase (threonine type)